MYTSPKAGTDLSRNLQNFSPEFTWARNENFTLSQTLKDRVIFILKLQSFKFSQNKNNISSWVIYQEWKWKNKFTRFTVKSDHWEIYWK